VEIAGQHLLEKVAQNVGLTSPLRLPIPQKRKKLVILICPSPFKGLFVFNVFYLFVFLLLCSSVLLFLCYNISMETETEDAIQWQTQEHEHYEKTPDWFWGLWVFGIAIIVLLAMTNKISTAILVFVIMVTLTIQSTKKPRTIKCIVDSKGIVIYGKKYLFKNIESFCILEDEFPRILLKSKKKYMPFITIPVGDADTEEIEKFLLNHLKKEEHSEPISYKLMRYF